MVKICAALAWFDEPVAFLDRLVRSLPAAVDHLVAVDGRWRLFADGTYAASPRAQLNAIGKAALDVGLPVHLVTVDVPWESQVEKRDELMRLAGEHGDWILVVDGDEWIESCDGAGVREQLARTPLHVASAMTVPVNRRWPYSELPSNPRPVRKLYRAGTRVQLAHNGYRFGGEWLGGDPAHVRVAATLDLSDHVRIPHDNQNRGPDRDGRAKAYRRARERERVEAWT